MLAALACAMTAAGCGGPARSATAYCNYFYGEGSQLRNRWIQADKSASSDPFAALGTVFSAMPELTTFMHQLSLRAPDEIQPAVETLAETFKHESEQEGSAASDPLGALAGGLVDGLAASGSEQQVNQYTEQHCGAPPGSTTG
jgi:hypothetical protein